MVGPEATTVPVEDILEDLQRFTHQAVFYLQHRLSWPCVLLDKTDMIGGEVVPRYVPIDLPGVEEMSAKERRAVIDKIRTGGVPVTDRPITIARDGFAEGAVDAILGRAKWLKSSHVAIDPEVEVTTDPPGDDILYSKGHFFSTARGFGRSNVKSEFQRQPIAFIERQRPRTLG